MEDESIVSYADTVSVILIGLLGTALSEGIPWLVVYRSDSYSSLKAVVEKSTKKLDKAKEAAPKNVKADSRLKNQEKELDRRTQELNWMRMKGNFLSAVVMLVVLPLIYGIYDGVVVARLPFTPILMFKPLARQTLSGSDERACSMMFLYMLALMFFRANIQKIFGTAPPRTAGPNFQAADGMGR
eukprot:GHVU01120038.1.p1 GENE.GHVU01120038.1~~GHVU01120038.1.p1  ORF type:complete len:185 (+),score=17.05 GHVU01120038.1:61-615(+)